jgi:hypothetical protein
VQADHILGRGVEPFVRRASQRLAHQIEIIQFRGTRGAPLDMSTHSDLLLDVQLTVAIRGQMASDVSACSGHGAWLSFKHARSAWRARVSRAFTVPRVTPSENAISS